MSPDEVRIISVFRSFKPGIFQKHVPSASPQKITETVGYERDKRGDAGHHQKAAPERSFSRHAQIEIEKGDYAERDEQHDGKGRR